MSAPVFEDVEPPPDCRCEQCARRRLTASVARDSGGHTATGATRVVVMAAAAGSALGAAAGAVAAAPLPAGVTGFTTGPAELIPARTALVPAATALTPVPTTPATTPLAAPPLRLTRAQILERAENWVAAKVPYSMTSYWKDGYRQDCSGFVSMAWGLNTNAWTGDLASYGVRITRDELEPGDILLFHNTADPQNGSHTVVFGGWVDSAHTEYTGYEQTLPGTRVQTTPYAYWVNSSKYVPYRYKYLAGSGSSAPTGGSDAFPGAGGFRSGAKSANVTRLGTMLIGRGAATYYKVGAGPKWTQADGNATAAFQRAQGWSGSDADGIPGPTTWRYLVYHLGHDISGATRTTGGTPAAVVPYPGADAFRPGRTSEAVLALGRRLVAKGFGTHYRTGPSRTWGEADRRNVEAFQRAQGWSGRKADGHPGPETWRRLFS
jgi:hypothetical protein